MPLIMIGSTVEAEPLRRSLLDTAENLDELWLAGYAFLGLGWISTHDNFLEAGQLLDQAAVIFPQLDNRRVCR